MATTIVMREGNMGRGYEGHVWRQYEIIRDNSVVIFHLQPGYLGWNVASVDRQGDDEWCGMSAASIVDFKFGKSAESYGRILSIPIDTQSVLELEAKYAGHTGKVTR